MFTPRHAITAGVVLLVLAGILATGGHGFWIIFPLLWMAGPRRCGGLRRWERPGDRSRGDVGRDEPPAPDPNRDRHEAFPGSR